MSKKARIYGLSGLSLTIIGFLGKTLYRDFVNSKGIIDYGLAGFLPSFFYVAGFSLLLLIRPTKYKILTVSIVTFASILFEVYQFLSTNIIDTGDIIASVAGGITSIVLMKLIERKSLDQNNE